MNICLWLMYSKSTVLHLDSIHTNSNLRELHSHGWIEETAVDV
jgi:hypothetical protein